MRDSCFTGEGKLEKIRHVQTNSKHKTRTKPMWSIKCCEFTFILINTFPFFPCMSSFFLCFRDCQNNQCWKLNFM